MSENEVALLAGLFLGTLCVLGLWPQFLDLD